MRLPKVTQMIKTIEQYHKFAECLLLEINWTNYGTTAELVFNSVDYAPASQLLSIHLVPTLCVGMPVECPAGAVSLVGSGLFSSGATAREMLYFSGNYSPGLPAA